MANLSQLREFEVFAKYLNISKASEVLFTSQSNLSKHLKQLETELGFELTTKKGGHIFLTNEGAYFLTGIQAVLADYDKLIEECRMMKNNEFLTLTLQDPPFFDQACIAYYKIVNRIQDSSKKAQIDFAHKKFKDRQVILLNGEMDLILEYHCGDLTGIIHEYESRGIKAVQISKEPLAVWGHASALGNMETMSLRDFNRFTIMRSSNASSPMTPLMNELREILGFEPKTFVSPARSAAQYYYDGKANNIFLLPKSYTDKEVFTSRSDMRTIPIEGDVIPCRGIALISKSGKNYSFLETFLEEARID